MRKLSKTVQGHRQVKETKKKITHYTAAPHPHPERGHASGQRSVLYLRLRRPWLEVMHTGGEHRWPSPPSLAPPDLCVAAPFRNGRLASAEEADQPRPGAGWSRGGEKGGGAELSAEAGAVGGCGQVATKRRGTEEVEAKTPRSQLLPEIDCSPVRPDLGVRGGGGSAGAAAGWSHGGEKGRRREGEARSCRQGQVPWAGAAR